MNKISFIIEFDEISKIQERQLTEFLTKTGIKFHVLESDNDLKKYKKYKEVIDKIDKYINDYNVFEVFSFPLMKRWEEEQVKSSIDYEFKTSLIKDLKDILKEME